MDAETIETTFRWTILLAMVILLGVLAAFIIFANVREESSHGLHEIIGGLLVLTATYANSMFRERKSKTPPTPVAATLAPPPPMPMPPVSPVKK